MASSILFEIRRCGNLACSSLSIAGWVLVQSPYPVPQARYGKVRHGNAGWGDMGIRGESRRDGHPGEPWDRVSSFRDSECVLAYPALPCRAFTCCACGTGYVEPSNACPIIQFAWKRV